MSNKLETEIVAIEEQQDHGESVFPYAYFCKSDGATLEDAKAWVAQHRDALLDLATTHGTVFFRGFPTGSVEAFDEIVQSLGLPNFPYKKSLSNAVRVNRTERVFSANEAPPEVNIFFHHEMAQTPLYPKWIMFYCEIAAEEGGATPICRSDVLYDRLAEECPDYARDCETKGLRYTNVMPGENDSTSGMGRSWGSTLGVETREQAEDRLKELGYSWNWREDGCLEATTPVLPAVKEISPGRKTFFNQLIAANSGWKDSRNDPSKAIRHGDGSKLDPEATKRAIELAQELTFDVRWEPGDFCIIDNTVAMHARRPFKGTRKVVASLAEMETHGL
ncbi:MAG: SyrP protein [Verrucomicrobiales bacterium]|nr:SyrP protein [Verrucomicrobiales bacterium]|tara:strand:- start:1879 stop:2880 length:1002 start_codon:yes stop_codon:yes gene_type:complete